MTRNVGSAVLKAEAISYGAIKVSVRHACGHPGTYVLHTAEQARLAANRVCEACAPPAEETV